MLDEVETKNLRSERNQQMTTAPIGDGSLGYLVRLFSVSARLSDYDEEI